MKMYLQRMRDIHVAPQGSRSGQSMIGLMVCVVIMIVLALAFIGPRIGKNGESRPSIAKQSIERSKVVGVGGNNTSQIGMCIEMYKGDNNGQVPADLPALKAYCKDISAPMWVDPTDGRPYQYDPQTGRVFASAGAAPSGIPAAPAGVAPGAPAPAQQPLPGVRGPGGVRLPDAPAPMPAEGTE